MLLQLPGVDPNDPSVKDLLASLNPEIKLKIYLTHLMVSVYFFMFLFSWLMLWTRVICLSSFVFLTATCFLCIMFQEQKIRGLCMMGLEDGIFLLSWFIAYDLQVGFLFFCIFVYFMKSSQQEFNQFNAIFLNIVFIL